MSHLVIDQNMKQCSRCKKVKSRFDFYKDRTTLDGLRPSCIACRKESFEFITREFKFGERKYLLTEIKICSSCKKEKKREEFHRKTCAIDGLCESCKTCRKQQHQRLLEKRRDSNLQNTRKRRARKRDNGSTGFTKAHLVLLQEKQGATCPYCATYRQGQRPHRISLSRRASYHFVRRLGVMPSPRIGRWIRCFGGSGCAPHGCRCRNSPKRRRERHD